MDAKKPTFTDRILNALIPYRAEWQWGREELALQRAENARVVEDLLHDRRITSLQNELIGRLRLELEQSTKNATEVRAALWPHLAEALRDAAMKFAGISSALHSADFSDDYEAKNRERQECEVLQKQCLRVFAVFPFPIAHAAVEQANALAKANWQHHDWTELREPDHAAARRALDKKVERSAQRADRQEEIVMAERRANTEAVFELDAFLEKERAHDKKGHEAKRKPPSVGI